MQKITHSVSDVVRALVVLFMLFDSTFKFVKPDPVVKGTQEPGYAEDDIIVIGILGFFSTILNAAHGHRF